jgi:hypothetical protein
MVNIVIVLPMYHENRYGADLYGHFYETSNALDISYAKALAVAVLTDFITRRNGWASTLIMQEAACNAHIA